MNTILRGIVRPLLERVGTMIAAYLIARGIDSDLAAQLVNGVIAVAFVVLDLTSSAVNRQRDETKLIAGLLVGIETKEGA